MVCYRNAIRRIGQNALRGLCIFRLWCLKGLKQLLGCSDQDAGLCQQYATGATAFMNQFADKAALFREVIEVVEQDVMGRMAVVVAESGATTPTEAVRAAVDAWLDVSGDPEVRQLILLDAPSVLGWAEFRDVAQRYSLGMTEQMLTEAIRAGELAEQPVRPLAHVLIGALDEAAMVIATADDPKRTRRETGEVLHRLIGAMFAAR